MEHDYNLIRRRLANLPDEDVKSLVSLTALYNGVVFYKLIPHTGDVDLAKDTPILKPAGKCQYENCDKDATHIACGRKDYHSGEKGHPEPAVYCEAHAETVTDENAPEYTETCPNCSCMFGVN